MLRAEIEKWGQSRADVQRLALTAEHSRTRFRWFVILTALDCRGATQTAAKVGRRPKYVMKWLHIYNERGPDALTYIHTGGRTAVFSPPKILDCGADSRLAAR